MEILFKNEGQVTDQWLEYLEQEATSLAETSNTELEIENFMDRQALNPQMEAFLSDDDSIADLLVGVSDEGLEPITLNAVTMNNFSAKPSFLRFRKLKRKIRKIFCSITGELDGIDWKDIIKQVLVALLPAFAGGIPAITLPIVIGLVAILMKKGYTAVCPA